MNIESLMWRIEQCAVHPGTLNLLKSSALVLRRRRVTLSPLLSPLFSPTLTKWGKVGEPHKLQAHLESRWLNIFPLNLRWNCKETIWQKSAIYAKWLLHHVPVFLVRPPRRQVCLMFGYLCSRRGGNSNRREQ